MIETSLFTAEQGNLLIRLLMAHLLADFVFQSKKMVENKQWFSKYMLFHIGIVYITSAVLSGWWILSGLIAVLHYITDGVKITLKNKGKIKDSYLFIADQKIHFFVILIIWAAYFSLFRNLYQLVLIPFTDYKWSLVLLGYLFMTSPLGFLIGIATRKLQQLGDNPEGKSDRNGFWIGVSERVIIFTFMLLEEYGAIGFLIAGKSIIRFSTKNEDKKSEYVLLGTMLSYGVAIVAGIVIRWMLMFG
ncbi:DUF3307 domain-containing protein [Flavobacterium beibuense]|uniref:DUF3307 domain containing protein n=1 Tax=Flavobacterium beibuense TaxID=657326 RepID=A0A444WF88_9FLAO|nr:DUF3307 domain-containing protein [Flavobacterium beibuense]RYJ44518.1 DUF3307 domain containing protein [Flavobacterium beibuense]